MGKITKIEKQKKDSERVSIYIDGEFKTGLDGFVAVKYRLKEGAQVSEPELELIIKESDGQKAFEKAMAILTKRPKTEKQIRQYLKEKEYDGFIIGETVQKLKYYNYLNDSSYAQNFVSFHKKEWGIKRIKMELKQDGVSEEIIEEILVKEGSQEEEAYELAKKYVSRKDEFKREKIFNFLYMKGFSSDDISAAIAKLKEVEKD